MDDDYPITHSPLERIITRDGITVEIGIYRGNAEPGWTLEVLDHTGGSTIWDDLPSDQAALDLALQTIEEEGIGTFAAGMDTDKEHAFLDSTSGFMAPLPFDEDELIKLRSMLGERSLAHAVGLLSAVVSVPQLLPSQLWLGELMNSGTIEDHAQAEDFANLIMRLHNHIATAFMDSDPFRICPAEVDGADEENEDANAEFCDGYLSIVRAAGIDPESNRDLQHIARIAEREAPAWSVRCDFDAVLASLHDDWRTKPTTTVRRSSPKVGRNDPCHCGSGRKFKKCHGAPS